MHTEVSGLTTRRGPYDAPSFSEGLSCSHSVQTPNMLSEDPTMLPEDTTMLSEGPTMLTGGPTMLSEE